MAKAWLSDDLTGTPCWSDKPALVPTKIALDDDGCGGMPGLPNPLGGCPTWTDDDGESSVNPTLTLSIRTRNGYDDDGTPQYRWTAVVTGMAIVWTKREEFDAQAGMTLVKATATLGYAGDHVITETASVKDSDGKFWRVTSVRQLPTTVALDMSRIEATDVGADT